MAGSTEPLMSAARALRSPIGPSQDVGSGPPNDANRAGMSASDSRSQSKSGATMGGPGEGRGVGTPPGSAGWSGRKDGIPSSHAGDGWPLAEFTAAATTRSPRPRNSATPDA